MDFKSKKSKTMTRKDAEQNIRAINDIVPVYPNIATKIPKNEEFFEKCQNSSSTAMPMNYVSEYERPKKLYEQSDLPFFEALNLSSKPRKWYIQNGVFKTAKMQLKLQTN